MTYLTDGNWSIRRQEMEARKSPTLKKDNLPTRALPVYSVQASPYQAYQARDVNSYKDSLRRNTSHEPSPS